MKITYFAKFNKNKYAEVVEKPISAALKKLGHTVYELDVMTTEAKELIDTANKSDIFLFHNGGVVPKAEEGDELTFYMGLNGLLSLLSQIKVRKIMWYLDRVDGIGDIFMNRTLQFVDHAFLNDDTWVRRHKFENVYGLHLGATERPLGKFREDLACDIAFVGRVFDGREEVINGLKGMFGGKFKVFSDIWGKDFDDLCQSAKIIIQPKWLMNDFYWQDQIYHILSSGGFLVHPRLYGLVEEGLEDGNHYIGFSSLEELVGGIEFFLKPENNDKRKTLSNKGRTFVNTRLSWEERLKTIFSVIKNNLIEKQK